MIEREVRWCLWFLCSSKA